MQKPNIVYILADDMGYGDLSCLNENSKIKTENLDKLAAEGMKFSDAHSSSAVCTPSRYSILTGRYNWRSSLKKGVNGGYTPHLIEPGRMTTASYLKSQGYNTGCVGKWHLGMDWITSDGTPLYKGGKDPSWSSDNNPDIDYSRKVEHGPTTNGFDYYFGISASLDMPPYVYIENDKATEIPDRVDPGYNGEKFYYRPGPMGPEFKLNKVTPQLTGKACDYIKEQSRKDNPFYLYFPLPSPHTPIYPEEFSGKSGTNEYGDFCLMVDWCVGEVMKTLDACGISENTILIFTSDNGCSPQANFEELKAAGHNPSYIFRGHKADIYEGGHRIPLLVRWPETIKAGSSSNETVCLVDFLATCADIMEEKLPGNAAEDSVSNLQLWQGKELSEPLREATVHHSINGSFSIRQRRWKLEFCPGSGGWSSPKPNTDEVAGLPPIQLYDLDADIGERANLQDKYPEIVSKLTDLMTKYVKEGRSTPGTPQENTGPKYWPQLNWLMEKDL